MLFLPNSIFLHIFFYSIFHHPLSVKLHLAVEVVVSIVFEVGSGVAASAGASGSSGAAVGEPEVVSESSGLLEGLGEHLVLLDVLIGHGSSGKLHGLLEMSLADLGHLIIVVHVHVAALDLESKIKN